MPELTFKQLDVLLGRRPEQAESERQKKYKQAEKDPSIEMKPRQPGDYKDNPYNRSNLASYIARMKQVNLYRIERQLYNIAQNISFYFFTMPDKKFYELMTRVKYWGLDTTIEQFIFDYYLYIKTDSYLRNIVVSNFNRIVKLVNMIIQRQSVQSPGKYFITAGRNNLQYYKDQLRKSEQKLQKLVVKKEKEEQKEVKQPDQVLYSDADTFRIAARMKDDILRQLKEDNPDLEAL